jgi:hypothetical protein
MLQCNRYPGLDANEIIRLTSAIGHKLPQKAPSKFFFLRSGERPVYGEQLEARYASQPRLGQNQTFSPPGELLLDELLHTETRRTALRVT